MSSDNPPDLHMLNVIVADPGVYPPAVRSLAHRRPPVTRSLRLCLGRHARPARLAIFEATGADIADLGEGTATGCCAYAARAAMAHPHMLRHTFVTTVLDAGVDLRDVQIAARHADPRTAMGYDRPARNLDRHPSYILAAFMASGT